MAITPSFSPSIFCENKENASLISVSSAAVILCSLASLDRGPAAGAEEVSLRFAGWEVLLALYLEGGLKGGYHFMYQTTRIMACAKDVVKKCIGS